MRIVFLTLFPEYFDGVIGTSILKRAQATKAVSFEVINIRDFATDSRKTTDDRPFGGGAGMVMKVEPIFAALEFVKTQNPTAKRLVLLTSAKGALFTQEVARSYTTYDELIIICGHYEGVDERVAQHLVDGEVRIGDFVLTGGEPAASVMADAVVRLLPGVLGNENSTKGESHDQPGILGYPQFTRPEEFNGWKVPQELLSGDHKKIVQWRETHRG